MGDFWREGGVLSKAATAAQRRRMGLVADLGCILCRRPAQIHHCGTGAGGRRNHDLVLPLCIDHHTSGGYGIALHAGRKEWIKNYGDEQILMDKVEFLLSRKTV